MDTERYAIVIPFYDGLETIQALVCRIIEVFSRLSYEYQVILVDDSADEAKNRILNDWFGSNTNIRLITLPKNQGQHYATFQGIKAAADRIVITLDEDLQHSPEEIPTLIKACLTGKFDVVYGNRNRRDCRYWVGRMMLALCFPKGPITTSSFRILRQEFVCKLSKLNPEYYEIEGMVYHLFPKYGYANIQVERTGRSNNKSSYSLIKTFFLIINLIAHYSWLPIILISILCLFIQLLLFGFIGIYAPLFMPISSVSILALIGYERKNTA